MPGIPEEAVLHCRSISASGERWHVRVHVNNRTARTRTHTHARVHACTQGGEGGGGGGETILRRRNGTRSIAGGGEGEMGTRMCKRQLPLFTYGPT